MNLKICKNGAKTIKIINFKKLWIRQLFIVSPLLFNRHRFQNSSRQTEYLIRDYVSLYYHFYHLNVFKYRTNFFTLNNNINQWRRHIRYLLLPSQNHRYLSYHWDICGQSKLNIELKFFQKILNFNKKLKCF